MDKLWKVHERITARIFGGERNPLSGENSRHTSGDIIHKSIYAETKTRKKMPFARLYKDTVEKAKRENKIPVIVLFEKGSHNPMILCSIYDIKKIANEIVENNPDILEREAS